MLAIHISEKELFVPSRGRIKPMLADDEDILKARTILQWAKVLTGPVAEVHAKALIAGLEATLKRIDAKDGNDRLARLFLDILVQCTVEQAPGWYALKAGERDIFNYICSEARRLTNAPKSH